MDWPLDGEKLDGFFVRSGAKEEFSFTPPIQHYAESPSHCKKTWKRIKDIKSGKEERKLLVWRWCDSLCRKSQRTDKKNLELRSDYSKVSGAMLI